MNQGIKWKEEIRKEGKRKKLNSARVLQLDPSEKCKLVHHFYGKNHSSIMLMIVNTGLFTTHLEGIQ